MLCFLFTKRTCTKLNSTQLSLLGNHTFSCFGIIQNSQMTCDKYCRKNKRFHVEEKLTLSSEGPVRIPEIQTAKPHVLIKGKSICFHCTARDTTGNFRTCYPLYTSLKKTWLTVDLPTSVTEPHIMRRTEGVFLLYFTLQNIVFVKLTYLGWCLGLQLSICRYKR